MDERGAAYWEVIDAAFTAASELDPPERRRYLDARFAGTPEMRAEVESLLDAHERAAGFLLAAPLADEPGMAPPPGPGAVLSGYRLNEGIGDGGMGQVFRATRADGSFSQHVAVKVSRNVVGGGESAHRFRAERQILASLHHPNIVSLLDGGVAPTGHAYLVMELVEGTPIARFCAERALALEARIDLFRQVCSAVHYAHRHGVVHRDIKPANILVTGEGVAKVLDFGIAKLLAPPEELSWHTTDLQPVPLTPNYASPEQLRRLPVTTASDVYSLGVLLYELVTGVRPYDTAGLSLDRMLDLVVGTDPVRPSAAPAGGATLPYPRRRLRGDLDAIVLRALAKDVDRRYASADELAEDLRRFLGGRPVVAREPSLGYLLRRMASRNRVAVGVVAVAMATVVLALALALLQWRSAERQRTRAERRFGELRQLANALIFKIHDGVAPLQGSTAVRKTIVAEAVKYLEGLTPEAGDDPTLALELATAHRRIGQVLGDVGTPNLGDREGALHHLGVARGLLERMAASGSVNPVVLGELVLINRLSSTILGVLGRRPESVAAAARAVAVARRLVAVKPDDRRHRETLGAAEFTSAVQQHGPAAIPAWRRTLATYESLLAEQPNDGNSIRNVALSLKYLANAHKDAQEPAEAESLNRRALALDERRLALEPDSRQAQFDVAIDLLGVAVALMERADYRGAAPLLERSVELRRRLVDSDPADVLARGRLAVARLRLASARVVLRQFDHVEPLLADAEAGLADVSRIRQDSWVGREVAVLIELRTRLAEARREPQAIRCALLRKASAAWVDAASSVPLTAQEERSRASVAERLRACPATFRDAASPRRAFRGQ